MRSQLTGRPEREGPSGTSHLGALRLPPVFSHEAPSSPDDAGPTHRLPAGEGPPELVKGREALARRPPPGDASLHLLCIPQAQVVSLSTGMLVPGPEANLLST